MYPFHQSGVCRTDFLFSRPRPYAEDFSGLRGTQFAGSRIAPTLLFLLPLPLAFSRRRFSLPFFFFSLPALSLSLRRFPLLLLLLFLLAPLPLSRAKRPLSYSCYLVVLPTKSRKEFSASGIA